eukprot:1381328-Pleurochrysis_carterae.AAC.1
MPLNFTAGPASPLCQCGRMHACKATLSMESALRLTCRFKSCSSRNSSPSPTGSPPCKRRSGACKPGAGLTSSPPFPTFPFA